MKKISLEGWIAILLGISAIIVSIFVNEVHQFLIQNFMVTLFVSLICVAIFLGFIALTNHVLLKHKSKIIELKKFRDNEMIRIVNHYNAQLKTFEDRLLAINKKVNAYSDDDTDDPNELKNEIENETQKNKEIKEYNKSFQDWGLGNYGLASLNSIYKDKEFGT